MTVDFQRARSRIVMKSRVSVFSSIGERKRTTYRSRCAPLIRLVGAVRDNMATFPHEWRSPFIRHIVNEP
jgi:hypothetical protein